MERVLVAGVLVAVAVAVALVLQRRRPDAPTAGARASGPGGWAVPSQLDRADFVEPSTPWLVAVFTSATCDACAATVAKAEALRSPAVAVQDVELSAAPDLHRRYAVDAVPLLVLADAEGVVRASFVGPPSATDLWAAVAEVRDGGAEGDGGAATP